MDISNYNSTKDWIPITASVVFLEALLILWFRYSAFWGKDINIWYNRFGVLAVLSDIFIVLIGFALTRYLYTLFVKPKYGWNMWMFLAMFLAIQIIHDILYYLLIIKTLPRGVNNIIDFMKTYANNVKTGAIMGDSLMVILMTLFAFSLNTQPTHISIFILLLGFYIIPYALTTNSKI